MRKEVLRIGRVFSPLSISRSRAIGLAERSAALTHLTSSVEYLAGSADFEPGGINDWEVQRCRFAHLSKPMRVVLDVVASRQVTTALHFGRAAASLALLGPTSGWVRTVANGYLAVTSTVLYARHNFGTDGSDQVSLHTQASMFLARAAPTPTVQDAALWYIAIQSGLSYAVSGWVKVAGSSWRDGSAVPGVLGTQTYGCESLWMLFKDRPKLAALSAHGMLAFEGLFPLVFVTRGALVVPFVLWAIGFHLSIGVSMGLGRFVTSFSSMLPAVVYVTGSRSASRAVPWAFLAGALVAGAAGLESARRRRQRILRRGGSLAVHTRSNLNLQVNSGFQPRSNKPVVVFETGLLSTPEIFGWLVEFLGVDVECVTYARAGSGGSSPSSKPFTISGAAGDLADVVKQCILEPRSVYLLGHSLGGLIVRRAAEELGDLVAGIVYVDSSHPAQLARSSNQRKGSDRLQETLATIPASLSIGLGWQLDVPEWIASLPTASRDNYLDEYRDARLWRAGIQEWDGLLLYLQDEVNHRLGYIESPALVITAGRTSADDPVHADLQREIADSHGAACHATIDGADHLSIIASAVRAAECAQLIRDFVVRPAL